MPSRERLHILVLTDRDWTHPQGGGTGTNLFGQISRWVGWGHRVTVIACSYPGARQIERIGDVTVHRMGGRSTVFPRAILRQWRGLVPDADVVLEVVNGVAFLTPLWLRTPRVTLVHHIHRRLYAEELGRLGRVAAFFLETAPLRWLYRGSRFLTISNASANDLMALGIPREQIEVAYIGVEADAFAPDPARRAPEPTLLYLGRLKRYKRIEVVLDVIEAHPRAVLHLAGDGDHREALEAEIAARGLGERVRVHGHVSEERKRELYQRAWVNLTASSAEGWCLTVMEAAACGTPSAALAVGGLPESIEDGRTGILARDPRDLAAKTRRLLDDPELRDSLGRAALARAREFTWDATALRTLEVLREQRARAGAPSGPGAAEALEAIDGVEGWLSDGQARRLWQCARELPAGARIVEIGSYRGRSTIVLARGAPGGSPVVAIDPHAGNDRGPREIRGSVEEGEADNRAFRANLERAGVSAAVRHVRRPSQEALDAVDGPVDLLYVDGAHRFSPARADISRWGERVRPGGTLLVHDAFSSVGVTLALLRLLVFGREFRYLGRTRSLAEYERARPPLRGPARRANAARQLGQLPWFARNLVVKLALAVRLRPLARALGHGTGDWPY
jgi:glycosyltransferase involved in cell wall biosynthesis